MQIIHLPHEIQSISQTIRHQSKSIGLVPTMGALHDGHIALVSAARKENDVVIATIFVNPTQFNNPQDLLKYPKTIESDLQKLENVGCDFVFVPEAESMYPKPSLVSIGFGALESIMEGAFRPGHFAGVGLVVSKLFHLTNPSVAYFGQKDYQQVKVIEQLVFDLNFPVEICCCPTVRESDGLAMSSRNLRLSPTERALAPRIYQCLLLAKNLAMEGLPLAQIQEKAAFFLENDGAFRLEYLSFVSTENVMLFTETLPKKGFVICIAAFLGEIRLIDNVVVD